MAQIDKIKRQYEKLIGDHSVIKSELEKLNKRVERDYGVRDIDHAKVMLKKTEGLVPGLEEKRDKLKRQIDKMMRGVNG